MALMDKVGGWNEEKWVGSNFVACMWIFTKAVLCDGRRRDPPLDPNSVLGMIVENVTWVTEGSLWEHEWITDTNVTLKDNDILEALDYEKIVNHAIKRTYNIAFDRTHTPRAFSLRAVTVFLCCARRIRI